MLNGTVAYIVRVARRGYGYLMSQKQLQFTFDAAILNITPAIGKHFFEIIFHYCTVFHH